MLTVLEKVKVKVASSSKIEVGKGLKLDYEFLRMYISAALERPNANQSECVFREFPQTDVDLCVTLV